MSRGVSTGSSGTVEAASTDADGVADGLAVGDVAVAEGVGVRGLAAGDRGAVAVAAEPDGTPYNRALVVCTCPGSSRMPVTTA